MSPRQLISWLLFTLTCCHAHQREDRNGYLLRPHEGEPTAAAGVLIKASPASGTRGEVAILQPMTSGFSTGVHYHTDADEFFYVVSGKGTATIGKTSLPIEAGDFIFVPAGQDHRIKATEEVVLLVFLDRPGLDVEFRSELPEPYTLEQLNDLSGQHGTVYKTLE